MFDDIKYFNAAHTIAVFMGKDWYAWKVMIHIRKLNK
jgi:hypothetical protein